MKENNYERLTNTHSCMYDLNMITDTGKCTCMTKILNFLKELNFCNCYIFMTLAVFNCCTKDLRFNYCFI